MNTPVSFSLAKSLKDKGYPQFEMWSGVKVLNTQKCYANDCEFPYDRSDWNDFPDSPNLEISAPLLSQVVMWLYEKHGIWVVVSPKRVRDASFQNYMEFDPEIWRVEGENGCVFYGAELLQYKSPAEAYEAAIEYTLNKLI